MRRSLLALFRGTDGHSLAWALALLVLINAFSAGIHSGFAAGSDPGAALCGIADTAGSGGAPQSPAERDTPCCFAGCVSSSVALPAPDIALAGPSVVTGVDHPLLPVAIALAATPIRDHGPRGPPSLA